MAVAIARETRDERCGNATRGRCRPRRQGRHHRRRRRGRRRHRQRPRGGDPAGAGRHAGCWWSIATLRAGRAHGGDDRGARAATAVAVAGRRHRVRRDARDMVAAALDRFGRLDFLDNNVGIGSRGSVVDETPENWRRVMQVNVETMFLAAKHAIPAMIKTARRRRHRQRLVDLGAAPARAHRLLGLQGRGDRAHAGHGGRPRPRGHPRQLRRAGAGLHADGLRARHERRPRATSAARPRRSASRAPAGTSATPCASCSRTTRATSPATRWWSTAA